MALKENPRLKFDRVNEGANEFKLSVTLVNAGKEDSGQYKVVVKNSEGEASNTAHFVVKSK